MLRAISSSPSPSWLLVYIQKWFPSKPATIHPFRGGGGAACCSAHMPVLYQCAYCLTGWRTEPLAWLCMYTGVCTLMSPSLWDRVRLCVCVIATLTAPSHPIKPFFCLFESPKAPFQAALHNGSPSQTFCYSSLEECNSFAGEENCNVVVVGHVSGEELHGFPSALRLHNCVSLSKRWPYGLPWCPSSSRCCLTVFHGASEDLPGKDL